MKLFVWHGVFTDYTSGIAFAFAKSKKHAKELLNKEGLVFDPPDSYVIDGVSPKEYRSGFATWLYGGS